MSPIKFAEMLAPKPIERPKSNRLHVFVGGDDEAQVTNAVHAIRSTLGLLDAQTETRGLVLFDDPAPEALASMQGLTVRIESDARCNERPWPVSKEVFEAYFAVVPAVEHEHGVDVHWIDPPEPVQAVMSDYGRMGVVTDELFDLAVQGALEKLGLRKVRVQFWFDDREDHEGNRDCEFGFSILSVEEVE